MDQSIADRFRTDILEQAAHRYGASRDLLHPQTGLENYVYAFDRPETADRPPQSLILRISHSLRRTEALVQGELDWVRFLARGGADVALPVRSDPGCWVESIDDALGGTFLVTAFQRARGRPPWEVGWTPALWERYGRLLGTLHALTTGYQPPDPAWKRPDWNDSTMAFPERFLPESESLVIERYRTQSRYIAALPPERGAYGLIHQDAHGGNLLVDESGRLTLFDFDDCVYGWFAHDIAVVLLHAVLEAQLDAELEEANVPAFADRFLRTFLTGYSGAHTLEPKWLDELPHFLKLREMELYAVMHRDFADVDHAEDRWSARFLRGRKARIENDVPCIDLDFSAYSRCLAHQLDRRWYPLR